MKRVIAVLLLVIMLLGLTACGSSEQPRPTYGERFVEKQGFCVIEKVGDYDGRTTYLVYDPDTLVTYWFVYSRYVLSICPYYNSDGTVAIYNGK